MLIYTVTYSHSLTSDYTTMLRQGIDIHIIFFDSSYSETVIAVVVVSYWLPCVALNIYIYIMQLCTLRHLFLADAFHYALESRITRWRICLFQLDRSNLMPLPASGYLSKSEHLLTASKSQNTSRVARWRLSLTLPVGKWFLLLSLYFVLLTVA